MEALLDVNGVARLLSLSPWPFLGAEFERFVSQARQHCDGDSVSTTPDSPPECSA